MCVIIRFSSFLRNAYLAQLIQMPGGPHTELLLLKRPKRNLSLLASDIGDRAQEPNGVGRLCVCSVLLS